MSEDDGWEFVNLGDQQSFGIKTAGLEEKATACQMLVRLALGDETGIGLDQSLTSPLGVWGVSMNSGG